LYFDIKKIKARFLVHRLPPSKRYKTADTLKILRSEFGFSSNKLHDIMKQLGYGGKLPTTGKNLWLSCMEGDVKSWKMMKKYNVHDVRLLGKLYKLIAPWAKSRLHPNLNLISGRNDCCTFCGSSRIASRGWERQVGSEYQRFNCTECGKFLRGPNVPLSNKTLYRAL